MSHDLATEIRLAAHEERAPALALALGLKAGGSVARATLLETSDSLLYVALCQGRVVAALLWRDDAGASASLWPPHAAAGAGESLCRQLIAAALAARPRVAFVQALLENSTGSAAKLLREFDFNLLAKLCYMVRVVKPDEAPPDVSPLFFEPYQPAGRRALCKIVERTYQGTLDAPRLGSHRAIDDVLNDYANSVASHDRLWYLVHESDSAARSPIGCLLLGDHAEDEQLELIYMGLAPAARGRGWGDKLVAQAVAKAVEIGRRRVVLAVDSANAPAEAHYIQNGFAAWAERAVFVRLRADAKFSSDAARNQ